VVPSILLVLAIIAGFAAGAWFVFGQKYRHLFDEEHLFSELPDILARQKESALSRMGQPIESSDDPRLQMTTAGLSTVFTAEQVGPRLLNHISASYKGGPVALAFGAPCGYYILTFLGIDPASAAIAHSAGGVIHIGFILQPSEIESFRNRPIDSVSPDRIEALKVSAEAWRDSLLSDQRILRTEDELLPRLLHAT